MSVGVSSITELCATAKLTEQLCARTRWRTTTAVAHHGAVVRVINLIREHYQEPLTLQDMADVALLSPFHFNRVFRQITGTPPFRFLAAVRLEAAKRLILTTDISVTELCYTVGYSSLGSFTTQFAELVGLSPTRLRRLVHQMRSRRVDLSRHRVHAPALSDVTFTGRVGTGESFAGLIFVGLFPSPIPQGRPAGCSLLAEPGAYRIGGVVRGTYFIAAVGMDLADDPLHYLLPNQRTLLVGSLDRPISAASAPRIVPEITLRRPQPTDPPVIIALPQLLCERFVESGLL